MAASFESLDNILRDWAKDKVKKVREAGERKKKPFLFLNNDSEKILERSHTAVERD